MAKETKNTMGQREKDVDLSQVLSLLTSMKEENIKIMSELTRLQEENEQLHKQISKIEEEEVESNRLEESPNVTGELLSKLINRKSDKEVTIVHGAEMLGGMSTYIKLSTMTINFTRLGEERTLSWQQFEELCNTYRKFIDRGLIKVAPAYRELCVPYQIECYEDGSSQTLTTETLAKLPTMSEKELEECYNGLGETDRTVLLNYWLGQCYARPENKDKRFYNRYKIELLNRLSNSSIFDNIIADMNFEEARR